jgi:polyisoprenoid-binding protein YceI
MAFIPTLSAVALMATAPALFAEPVSFQIDPSHSQVSFNIRHFFTRVNGRFNDFSGTIVLDEKNLSKSSVEAVIQAPSIYTANEKRDKHLRTSDFFAADSFPTITFKSTKVIAGEQGTLKIEGNLTIRGITKPVVLDGNFMGAGAMDLENGMSAGYRAGFEASTTINRKDFGIVWNRTLDKGGTMLGDEVAIQLGVEAVRAESEKVGVATPAAGKK